jgi:predicted transcriptional regulator
MEVHLPPELQAKIDQLVNETGYPVEKLIEDALAGYVPEIAQTREMLEGPKKRQGETHRR